MTEPHLARSGGPGVLDGIRVIEWASWLSVPGAASMLGDLGADVVKIEDPIREATVHHGDAPGALAHFHEWLGGAALPVIRRNSFYLC